MAHAVEHTVGHMVKEVSEMMFDPRNQISVHLSNYAFVGGDVIQGNVHLDCIVPFQAKGVILKVKGYEYAEWEEWRTRENPHNPQEREQYIEVIKEKKEFFVERIRVYPYEGIVQTGSYDFPFSYQLPASLPGTFCDKGGHFGNGTGYKAEIIYFAKAKIDVKFKHDLKKKICFVINEKFDRTVQPSFGENSKTFLLTKGRLTSKVWLDKNCYFPGNTVIARLGANNTSTKPTNKLNVKVIKKIDLHVHSHHKSIHEEIYRQSYKGFEPCFFGVRWLPFQIPMNVQPSTTSSKMVKCMYSFVVECDIPGAIDLQVILPTAILAPQWLFSSVPPPPPGAPLPPDASFRAPWQPDSDAPHCTKCHGGFTLIKRRHHCRHCGKVFCANCTKNETKIPNLGFTDEPVKVCDECFPAAKDGGRVFQSAAFLPSSPPQEVGGVPL